MGIFNLHKELNSFYDKHVRLGADRRRKLAEYRDTCLDRLTEGFKKLGDERGVTYRTFTRYIGQGSYPMHTLNQHPNDEYDIDVAVIFDEEDLPTTALEARERVADALLATGGNFRKEPEARTNAVTVWYADGAHVDLAVYREVSGIFQNTLQHAGAEWSERDPEAVTQWFLDKVDSESPSFFNDVDDDQLRRVVRWIKSFARSRASWSLPGGMILTVLAVETYRPDSSRDDVALYDTITAMRDRLESDLDVDNPVAGGSLTSKPAIKVQMESLLEKLNAFLPVVAVLEDDACTRAQALRAWGKFFNHEYWGETAEAEGPQELVKSAGVVPINIAVGVARAEGKPTTLYTSDRIAIAKGKHLKFSLPLDWRTVEGATYHWLVRNTGDEARAANDMGHERENQDSETWRYTKYRGVHTMTCEVRRNGTVIGRGTRRVRVATW